jgi:hypothetical protein
LPLLLECCPRKKSIIILQATATMSVLALAPCMVQQQMGSLVVAPAKEPTQV